jgi:hypothetical protein
VESRSGLSRSLSDRHVKRDGLLGSDEPARRERQAKENRKSNCEFAACHGYFHL